MKKKMIFYILFLIGCAGIGFVGGYFLANTEIAVDLSIQQLIISFLILIIVQFIAVNIHEFGHFLVGKILGYRLLMYQIGLLAFTYENGKMKFQFKRAKGFAGLCAMIPPMGTNMLDKKHVFYYAGGIIINVVTGLLALIGLPFISNLYGQIFIAIFSFISIVLGLANLVPYKTAGNHFSDGKFIVGILKQSPSVKSMLTIQNTFTQLAGGIRPKDLLIDTDQLLNQDDPTLLLLQYYQALDHNDQEQFIQLIEKIIDQIGHVPSVSLPGFYYEILTAGILSERTEWIETYYPLAEKSLNQDQDLNGARVKAYYAWHQGDFERVQQQIDHAKTVAPKFPIRGQAEMELMLINNLQEKLNIKLAQSF
ncbi:M50 family metallopeptidase [Amphibacillus indicireducens]|uniref:Peptidase M50 domain-containing protein n=1 Tax=Amphibacillus indicireducens TaxID=1076330 RepID=A0ABP7VH16_9BACI